METFPRPRPFARIFTLPLTVAINYWLAPHYMFIVAVMVFGFIPLIDVLGGKERRNPAPDNEPALGADRRFREITWLCAPVQVVMVAWGTWVAATAPLSVAQYLLLAFSVGISSGVLGINVAHELIHRIDNRMEPVLGRIMLASVLYLHWAIEHVSGHHRTVATPEDPATARLGQSYWSFLPQTVIGGLISSWRIEDERLRRRGLGLTSHRVLRYLFIEAGIIVAVMAVFGWLGLGFFVLQSMVAVGLLESVNYLEHYGLLRRKDPDGTYERITPNHSWNQASRITNFYLFNLQRHCDHHAAPGRRYQLLRHYDNAPQLPASYAGMVLLTLIPPLWRRVMDPKVKGLRREV